MYLKNILQMGSLMLHFRNGRTLVECMRADRPCDELVLWDGTRIQHPAGRAGLLEAVQEIWIERIYTDGFYRPQSGDVIVDAGANIGLFAIYLARQNSQCKVFALEPVEENFRYLEKNVAQAAPANVTCCQMALGAAFGQGRMEAVGTRSLDHMLRAGGNGNSDVVPVIPLAGLFELTGAQKIDFLKVDIEGSERDVFAAAPAETLTRIGRIAMEYHDQITPGTLALVREKLAPSHDITVRPSHMEGCGILLARPRGAES